MDVTDILFYAKVVSINLEKFVQMVLDLLDGQDLRQELGKNLHRVIKYDNQAIANLAKELAGEQRTKEKKLDKK